MSTKMKINSQIFQDSNNTYFPKTEEEVSNLIKEFYKKNLPTEIVGTNTKSFIGNKTQASNKISLSKLSGIIDYFPEELYIKVKAGTPLEDVEKALEKNNQELAFVPIDFLAMMLSIVKMVILPVVLGLVFNHFFHGKAKWLDKEGRSVGGGYCTTPPAGHRGQQQ